MVRVAPFALLAALLASAPDLSFAEAAPALAANLPRQTMKPRYAHAFPKHIKKREHPIANTTTPTPERSSSTANDFPTTTPADLSQAATQKSQTNEDTTGGVLGISVPGVGGAGVNSDSISLSLLGVGVGAGINDGSSSSTAPITSAPESKSPLSQSVAPQSPASQSPLTSRSADPNTVGGIVPVSIDLSLGNNQGSSSSNSAGSSSAPANQNTQPNGQASATPSAGGLGGAASSLLGGVGGGLSSVATGLGGILTDQPTPSSSNPAPTNPVQSQPAESSGGLGGVVTSALGGVTSLVGGVTSAIGGVTSDLGGVGSSLFPTVTPTDSPSVGPTDSPVPQTTPVATPTPILSIPPLFGTTSDPATQPAQASPTTSDTNLLSIPPLFGTTTSDVATQPTPASSSDLLSLSLSPIIGATSTPATQTDASTPSQTLSQQATPTGPSTMTVVPVPETTPSTLPQTDSATTPSQSASANTQSASANTQSASAAVQTPPSDSATATPVSTPLSTPTVQPATSSAPIVSDQASSVPQVTPTATPAPTIPSLTPTTAPVSIAPTGSDTLTQVYVPTSLVVDTATQTPFTPPPATATFSSAGIPSSLPHVILPQGSNGVLPPAPFNSTLIQIGFQYQLNYPFVLKNPSAIRQIFEILPYGLAFGLDVPVENITMQSLQPFDTTRTQGFITTVALAYIPSGSVNNLTVEVPNRGSMLYRNTNSTRAALMAVIDSSFPVLAGAGGDGTSGGNPATTSTVVDSNPYDATAQNGTPVNGTAIGIGVGVCAGAAVYGAAMFFIAKRYKQRKSRHSRSSSMIDTASMANSHMEQVTGANTALMSGAGDSYGTRGASRNSNGSGHSSRGRENISAPVMAENSLGWN